MIRSFSAVQVAQLSFDGWEQWEHPHWWFQTCHGFPGDILYILGQRSANDFHISGEVKPAAQFQCGQIDATFCGHAASSKVVCHWFNLF
jgi:hypothetical protein